MPSQYPSVRRERRKEWRPAVVMLVFVLGCLSAVVYCRVKMAAISTGVGCNSNHNRNQTVRYNLSRKETR